MNFSEQYIPFNLCDMFIFKELNFYFTDRSNTFTFNYYLSSLNKRHSIFRHVYTVHNVTLA